MATSQDIENTVIADVKAVLDAASIANVVSEAVAQPSEGAFVRVAVLNLRDMLDGGQIPAGMKLIDMAVEPHSYLHDDTAGTTLGALVASVRAAIYDSAILSTLNTASTYNTYYGLLAGDDLPDTEDRYRIRSIQFSLVLKPEKAE